MKKNKKCTSIIEAMVAMLIILVWVIWVYWIYIASTRLETSTSNKIQAIAIAREWIEAMTNIRDTNWAFFSSDIPNCWNTLNYNNSCIWNTAVTDIENNWHYIIYQDIDNRWKLTKTNPTTSDYSDTTYRTNFRVWLDSNWFYTQSWATTELKPLFTREIIINYIDTNWDWIDSNDEKMEITSLVQWLDNSSTEPHKVELKTILTNRKKEN